jgi:hypothetical protein
MVGRFPIGNLSWAKLASLELWQYQAHNSGRIYINLHTVKHLDFILSILWYQKFGKFSQVLTKLVKFTLKKHIYFKQKSWCSIMLTHAKSSCLKVTLLSMCKPSNTWGSCSRPPRTVEHLATVSKRSLFIVNWHCVKLHIMDVKLRCDLFNTLVRSTASYACEVWVDSKKIKVIEVVYRRFFKSLFGVWKTTSTSIMLVEFCKFPFEHFACGQALLYYNRVNIVTKNRILGKAWEA